MNDNTDEANCSTSTDKPAQWRLAGGAFIAVALVFFFTKQYAIGVTFLALSVVFMTYRKR